MPAEEILQFAYALSWRSFAELFDAKGKLLMKPNGGDITQAQINNAQFSDQLINDLLALYLVPGFLVEYRQFLLTCAPTSLQVYRECIG